MNDEERERLDKLARDNEGVFEEAAAFLKLCEEAEGQNREKALRAKAFRWGDQWDTTALDERKNDGRPALTINRTNVECSRVENTLRQQRPRIKCHPVGGGASRDDANRINGLIRHIEDISTASVAYDNGAANSVDIGWGYWRIVSKYLDPMSFDQELMIVAIPNPFTVYMDPSAIMPDGRDQRKCLISETMLRQQFKLAHPNAELKDFDLGNAAGDINLAWESKDQIRLAEYYRIYDVRDELVQLSDGSIQLGSELKARFKSIAQLKDVIAAMGLTVKNYRPTTRCAVQWFKLNGRTVVDKREEPSGIYHIPVVRCESNIMNVNGKVLRKGMVQDMIDPAQMFNYTETQKTERYALAPKAPYVAYEGTTEGRPEWIDANRKNYSTLLAKAILGPDGQTLLPLPQRQQPTQAEAGMAEWSSSAERNLMAVAGMSPDNPEIQARIVSGNKYLQRRQGMQDLAHFQYYDKQTLAIAWTGMLLLERIPVYYDTMRQQRILGEDGQPEIITINESTTDEKGVTTVKNSMKLGKYSVVMDTGPGYATKREENAENMVELLNTPLGEPIVKTGADVVLRNFDFPGADELADRVATQTPGGLDKIVKGLPKQAQTIIATLQQQNQQLTQTIQGLQLEIKYKAGIQDSKNAADDARNVRDNVTRVHVASLQAKTDDANSRRDADGWRHENDLDAATRLKISDDANRTKLDVAEMQVAGKLLDTDLKGEHQKEAAQLTKAGTEDRPST